MLLNDPNLIKFLIDNYQEISFLSDLTKSKYIENIKKIAERSPDKLKEEGFKRIFNPSLKDTINVLDFWERLLIDAIKYLKWNDITEFPRRNKRHEKETAYKKISEGSLMVYYLKEYFQQFISFERLLYGAEQFYRDHVYHIIKVWLTGQYILMNHIHDGFPIYIRENKLKREDDSEIVFLNNKLLQSEKNEGLLYKGEEDAIWCLIALTHDLGYPLSKIEEINESIKKMMTYFAKTKLEEFSFEFPQQNQFINDAILKYMSSTIVPNSQGKNLFNTHIQAKYYLKFSRSFERYDHGLISCIVLVKNLVYFLETNFDFDLVSPLKDKEEARQFIIRREILRAIASHTCPEIYHLKPNTFSFILLFADELQFWGRLTFESMAWDIDKKYEVTLDSFSSNEVSFTIKCKKQPSFQADSLVKFFTNKAALFKKLLRVAVDASGRQFTFKFSIKDETKTTYEFIAEPMKRADMKLNGESIKHTDLQKIIPICEKGKQQYNNNHKLLSKYKLF
jgi:hypothetical protein